MLFKGKGKKRRGKKKQEKKDKMNTEFCKRRERGLKRGDGSGGKRGIKRQHVQTQIPYGERGHSVYLNCTDSVKQTNK